MVIPYAETEIVEAAERPLHRFALKYEIGYYTLWAPRLAVLVEECDIEPGAAGLAPPPGPAALPMGAAGLLRRSEPCPPDQPSVAWQNGLVRYAISRFERRFIDLRGDFESYLEQFSGKTRATLKRKLRKFAELSHGRIDWRQYRTPSELMAFHRDARAISQLSYQEKLFDAGLPADEAFLAGMRAQAQRGQVRAYLLFLDGRPISYLYCWSVGRRLQYGYLGFDPQFAAHSPGTVLQLLALEALFAEQSFPLFDFTEGDGDHKRLFATHSVPCATVLYLRPWPSNLLILLGHRLVSRLSVLVARLTERLGLKVRLRQLLRSRR